MDRLLALLADIYPRLREANVEPVLAGGLAVHFLVRQVQEELPDHLDPDLEPPSSPRRLSTRIRVTKDVDFAIVGQPLSVPEQVLLSANLQKDERVHPPPHRFHGATAWIDLMPWPAELPELADDSIIDIQLGPPVDSIRVVAPHLLVLMKVLAWTDRYEARDLVDLARLALLDHDDGGIAERLRGLDPSTDVRARALQVSDAFAHQDAPGPSAFIAAFGAELLRPFGGDDDYEDDIRQIVRLATRRLLAALP